MRKLYGLIIIALLVVSCSEKRKENTKEEIIGQWMEDSESYGAQIIMYTQGPNTYLKSMYGDQVNGTKQMNATEVDGKEWYVEKGGDSTIYYTINKRANLEIHNDQGLVTTYIKIHQQSNSN